MLSTFFGWCFVLIVVPICVVAVIVVWVLIIAFILYLYENFKEYKNGGES